jgi:hypothetical protein
MRLHYYGVKLSTDDHQSGTKMSAMQGSKKQRRTTETSSQCAAGEDIMAPYAQVSAVL